MEYQARVRCSVRYTDAQYHRALEGKPSLEFVAIEQPSGGWIVPLNGISGLTPETVSKLKQYNGFISVDTEDLKGAAEDQGLDLGGYVKIVHASLREMGFEGAWRMSKGTPGRPETAGRSVIFEASQGLQNQFTMALPVARQNVSVPIPSVSDALAA